MTDQRPRVFIPQEPHRWDHGSGALVPLMDFTPAIRHGDLRVCLPPQVSFQLTGPVTVALREKMRDFRPDDYLIAVGAPEIIVISSHIALTATGGKLNLLTWDKRERAYVVKELRL